MMTRRHALLVTLATAVAVAMLAAVAVLCVAAGLQLADVEAGRLAHAHIASLDAPLVESDSPAENAARALRSSRLPESEVHAAHAGARCARHASRPAQSSSQPPQTDPRVASATGQRSPPSQPLTT